MSEEKKTIYCTQCGSENDVNSKFCSNCGSKLGQSSIP
ncbi:MAG: zinc-ribbon domain-containing protein, partial [Lachnospiraceae bacterium]|nr:zinc-ribbon domain-containing protein [Lachnospiraceae bacterium]